MNSSARWLSSSQTAKHFLPRKPSIARCDIDLREDGWRGVTTTFPDSRRFQKSLTSSSLVIAGSARPLTRLLWGKDVRPPTYFWARRWFLACARLIYLIAFVSLWVQVDGLSAAMVCRPESIPAGGSRTTWRRRVLALLPTLCWFNSSNALSTFALRRRRCPLVAFDFRDRAGALARRPFCFLSVAHHCRTNLSQFSMGHSPARDWFLIDLSRAVATLAQSFAWPRSLESRLQAARAA